MIVSQHAQKSSSRICITIYFSFTCINFHSHFVARSVTSVPLKSLKSWSKTILISKDMLTFSLTHQRALCVSLKSYKYVDWIPHKTFARLSYLDICVFMQHIHKCLLSLTITICKKWQEKCIVSVCILVHMQCGLKILLRSAASSSKYLI